MPCDRIREQLTPYLDGELDGDRGTVIRGHLRSCDACAKIAEDEAVLRDGLRALPAQDPPASLWANVQAQLAQEEVAESKRPAWRRALARWSRFVPSAPRMATGALVGAAAVGVIYWKTRAAEPENVAVVKKPDSVEVRPPIILADQNIDVTDDLLREPARIVDAYERTIVEYLEVAVGMRTGWSEDRQAAFDEKVKTMRDAIARADAGKPKQRASRALIRYLEGAVIRDEIVLAQVTP